MKEVVPMDFQCMLKVEKSIVWHGKVEVEEFGMSKCVNCCRSMVSHCFVFDQSASDGYHFKGYLNGVNIGQFNEGSKASNGMSAHSGPSFRF
jgi:hypothetical protein